MKKIAIIAIVILGISVAMCSPTKVEKPTISWEEACEVGLTKRQCKKNTETKRR